MCYNKIFLGYLKDIAVSFYRCIISLIERTKLAFLFLLQIERQKYSAHLKTNIIHINNSR